MRGGGLSGLGQLRGRQDEELGVERSVAKSALSCLGAWVGRWQGTSVVEWQGQRALPGQRQPASSQSAGRVRERLQCMPRGPQPLLAGGSTGGHAPRAWSLTLSGCTALLCADEGLRSLESPLWCQRHQLCGELATCLPRFLGRF